jgi:hypothetical protein
VHGRGRRSTGHGHDIRADPQHGRDDDDSHDPAGYSGFDRNA